MRFACSRDLRDNGALIAAESARWAAVIRQGAIKFESN
jgi:hypothetical protein